MHIKYNIHNKKSLLVYDFTPNFDFKNYRKQANSISWEWKYTYTCIEIISIQTFIRDIFPKTCFFIIFIKNLYMNEHVTKNNAKEIKYTLYIKISYKVLLYFIFLKVSNCTH